jgi:hypothetical protein
MVDLLKRRMPFAVAKIPTSAQASSTLPSHTHPDQRIWS